MKLSPAERSYLHDSLALQPPIRPDARSPAQFRPLEASISFLPSSNGSARIRLSDGSECIVSVKSKVVLTANVSSLILVDVDVSGYRDDSNFVSNLNYHLQSILNSHFPTAVLRLTSRYSFKIFVDCVVLLHTSYPLGLLSLTTYLALKTTSLPKLVSEVNDEEVEEQPTFSDDWDQSTPLIPTNSTFQPPLLFVVAVVGDNVFIDPSREEQEVSENGMIIGYETQGVISPFNNISLSDREVKGMKLLHVIKAHLLVKKCGEEVLKALNSVAKDEGGNAIF
ncbi:hypothetical protein BABINDRAFT_160919 [Babjeviella inositovora NRRL Y-12698]|uniref:Ribosomal RNA-processing protein 42 n=1 Tax=Babjeviella inositovora NRRL Y-12698 TaxID=984486 RepID=A0A1E3QSK3_9ASCO|nr:uncharacterized protein BABINDRAFT_160919 [Babjeviella inositovora NRRL Y-12698]ODQ80683.1 hypothetical protein BABINDRAFT_160919 [Babjeviella inositovora NRRL Y-12698]